MLMGLKYQQAVMNRLLQGVMEMEESTFYQSLIRKGEVKALRSTLSKLGALQFGTCPDAVKDKLFAIDDPEELARMTERGISAQCWEELFDQG
jgi:hypothetical protein